MSSKPPSNLAASVRQRLLNLSRERGEDFNLTLVRYGTERLLYRITKSPYAEQFEAIVSLGFPNSRLKDFYDLWTMCRRLDFQGRAVARAIEKTFRRRQTEIPKATPMGLSEEFASGTSKRSQWRGFLRRHKLPEDVTLEEVVEDVRALLNTYIFGGCFRILSGSEPFAGAETLPYDCR
ncbi:MAG: nucleotidyl transferase AbiEii/AbiGii toxin family protein [Planctomycetes bacterium]|nr:nucleotidyl transferase AbiEii/AbiGii toxin family protein [Planctomycetota bacterium]